MTLAINALEPGTGVPIHRASLEFRDRSNLARNDLWGLVDGVGCEMGGLICGGW